MSSPSGPASTAPGYQDAPYPHTVPRPQHLGLAAGCTLAVGAFGLLGGGLMLLAALFLAGIFGTLGLMDPSGFMFGIGSVLGGFLVVLGLIPFVFGVVGILAGVRLNRGEPGAFFMTVTVHVVSLVFAALSLFAGGVGLLHAIPSGIALWALYQPDMKAYFGR